MYIQKSYRDKKKLFYVIPTPIGNLEDITIRSLNTLKELDILYCEDTRITKKLLNHFDITLKLLTYNEYTNQEINENILKQLESNQKVGIVSDAGMPLISDPGFKLIRYLKENSINVVILPGACAFLEPMVYFCYDNSPFIFRGFLSKQNSTYKKEVKIIVGENFNTIIYESPHRILKTLEYIKAEDLNNQVLIAREISKIYETYIQGTVEQVLEYVIQNPLKGEIVLVISAPEYEEEEVDFFKEVEKLIKNGASLKLATKEIGDKYSISKNKLYNDYLIRQK